MYKEEFKLKHKELFLSAVENTARVKCAYFSSPIRHFPNDEKQVKAILKLGYTKEDYVSFLNILETIRYGHGYIWLEDGNWISSEETWDSWSWEYYSCHEIYPELL